MPVYVDEPREYPKAKLRCKTWSHMVANTSDELEAMARLVDLQPEWIQNPGTPREHYDLVPTKRAKAIRKGAIPVSSRKIAEIITAKVDACAAREQVA